MKKKWKLSAVLLMVVLVGVLFTGCGNDSATVQMATKPMTEQYILGSMMKTLIEQDTDLTVELTEGVGGGTSNIQPAMEKGDFDFYPEYTGTGWNNVLKNDTFYTENLFGDLQSGYADLGMTWTGMLGFKNTYRLAVTKEAADKYNLKTFSDLAAVSDQLIFGANYDFYERKDGYPLLQSAYGMNFKDTMDMDIGLKYDAIQQKRIDVTPVFTTDGQLSASDIVVLEDDQGIYPSYLCGFVVRKDALETHPELQAVFDKVQNLISDQDMSKMNYQVETEGKSPEEVAAAFLKEKGLLNN
jgi:osmoprotectant transport system permease protein